MLQLIKNTFIVSLTSFHSYIYYNCLKHKTSPFNQCFMDRNFKSSLFDAITFINQKLVTTFSGQTFENGRSTIATVGTICAGKAVGISVDINVYEPHILAANLAHAIGHNLGFHHDSMEGKPSKIYHLQFIKHFSQKDKSKTFINHFTRKFQSENKQIKNTQLLTYAYVSYCSIKQSYFLKLTHFQIYFLHKHILF